MVPLRISMTVNGAAQEHDVEPRPCSCSTCASRWPHRHEDRVRHVVVRRVHGARRRRVGEVVHDARGPGRRRDDHDDRGPGRTATSWHPVQRRSTSTTACSAATAPPGMVMAAVSLLDEIPNPTERDVRDRPRGQPLPLHRLPQHREVGARGGGADAGAPSDPRRVRLRPRPTRPTRRSRCSPSTATTPSSSPAACRCCR